MEFDIPGNPRISEFSSVQSQFHQSPSQPDPHYQRKTRDQCIIPDEDPTRPISGDVEDEEGGYFDYMGEGEGDEDDGGEEEEDVGSASQKPAKPLPPAVKNGYQNALEFLKQTGPNSKPKLYETLQTFWIPRKANYFLLHGKSKPYPEQLYNYRWFYWDPDHLVEGGLKCPTCNNPLHRHGFTRPRRVVDLEDVYYMIGQRHLCRHCRHPRTNELSVTFNSWDSRIIERLPQDLAAEFPAWLSHRNALADSVLAVMRTCFQYGMGSKQFSNCLQVLQRRRFHIMHAQYLHAILSRVDPDPSVSYQPFGIFTDWGFAPSSQWLRIMYDKLIEIHGAEIDQKCAMLSAEIIGIDQNFKVCLYLEVCSDKLI